MRARQLRTFARVETPAEPPRSPKGQAVELELQRRAAKASGHVLAGLAGPNVPSATMATHATDQECPPDRAYLLDGATVTMHPVNEPDADLDEARPEIDALIARIVWRRRMHGDDAKARSMVRRLEQMTASLGYRVEGLCG